MHLSLRLSLAVIAIVALGEACRRPAAVEPDAGELPYLQLPSDGGVTVLPPDGSVQYPEVYAGEACPPEAFGQLDDGDGGGVELPDGSVQFGLCVALRKLTGTAMLNNRPLSDLMTLHFSAGGFESEIERQPDGFGSYDAKVMRGRYDILKYQPAGVFPTHKGFQEFGTLDMTRDQRRDLAVRSHSIRGSAFFGSLPFVPQRVPNDVQLGAFGLPQGQTVTAMSQAGSYEVSLLDGTFALFLTAPPEALYGTELIEYQLGTRNILLDRDQSFDINTPTRVVEGEITFDPQPIPNRRANGSDFDLEFVRPGDRSATVITHHEGGVASYSSMVPAGTYGVQLSLAEQPDRHYPAMIFGYPISNYIDLTQGDGRISANFDTVSVEGGLLFDNQPVRPNPNYDWMMYMFGFAGQVSGSSGLIYEVPMDSSSFSLRTFPGNYYVILFIDDNMGDDLASGWYIVNKYFQVFGDTQLPINIETATFTGKLIIDGKTPPAGEMAGTLYFRDRSLANQNSVFRRGVTCSEDGTFRVRLPKGDYEVYFEISRDLYPEYASGRHLILSRIELTEPKNADVVYDTRLVTGPLRVGGEVVQQTIGGDEVGLKLTRGDGREFVWGFEGGPANYKLRVPNGIYTLDFLINRNAIDGVAWGSAPMGIKLDASKASETLQTR